MRIISLTQSDGKTAFMRIYNDDVTVASQISKYLAVHKNRFTIVSSRRIIEEDIPNDQQPGKRQWRDSIVDNGSVISVDTPKAKLQARQIMARLIEDERSLLNDRRTQAEIENNTTLIDQIDARKVSIQSTVIPQIRAGITNAGSLGALKTVRADYLQGRLQL